MRISAIILLISAAAFISCDPTDIFETDFRDKEDEISLTISRKRIFSYNAPDCQISYNNAKKQFRVSDDNMGNFFVLTCSHIPEKEGDTVTATLQYTTDNNIRTESHSFKVSKTTPDGKIWLWSQKKKIGAVVQLLN